MNERLSLFYKLLIGILLVAAPVKADNQESVLLIVHQDGDSIYVDLNQNPKITFSPDVISISTGKLEFKYEKVLKFAFMMEKPADPDPIPSSIAEEGSATAFSFKFVNANTICISGLASAKGVFISSLDGKHFTVPMEQSGVEITLHLASLPYGAYIVVTPKQTYKFIKK